MPYYEYHCPMNGCTVEVRHGMDERLETWGQLAERAGLAEGDTPGDAPVARLMSAPTPLTGNGAGGDEGFAGCGDGCACVPRG